MWKINTHISDLTVFTLLNITKVAKIEGKIQVVSKIIVQLHKVLVISLFTLCKVLVKSLFKLCSGGKIIALTLQRVNKDFTTTLQSVNNDFTTTLYSRLHLQRKLFYS